MASIGHIGPEEHLPYALGLTDHDELSPHAVQTHREVDRGQDVLPLHSHPFWELGYVRIGMEWDYVIGQGEYRLHAGDILFIPPGIIHGPAQRRTEQGNCIRDVIWLSPRFLEKLALLEPNVWLYEQQDAHLFRTAGTRWESLGELFEQGITERQKRQFGWEAMVVGNTMVLLSQLCRGLLEESVLVLREEQSDLLFRVTGYLEEHLAEKLTLESVAGAFDVSKSTITQMFRKKLDTSFYAWLTRRRLASAKALIARGTPLEQVGKCVGFKEHSAFYRAFRQEFGISPREYRMAVRSGEERVPAQKETL